MAAGKNKSTLKTRATRRAQRKQSKSPPGRCAEARHNIIELGSTRIGDLYGQPHDRPLLAVLDAGLRTIYVADGGAKRARKVFRVRKAKGDVWAIDSSKSPGNYRVKSLEDLDMKRLIRTTDVFAIGGYKCVVYKKGTCIDFYYPAGGFAYSWRATDDTGLCTHSVGDCQELNQSNTVSLFPGSGCSGTPKAQTVDWMFCTPA